MRPVSATPALVGLGVGIGDGIINPGGDPKPIAYAHLVYPIAVLGVGWVGTTGHRGTARGRWDPNLSYGLMTAGSTLLFMRLPAVFHGGAGLHAYGLEHKPVARQGGGYPADYQTPSALEHKPDLREQISAPDAVADPFNSILPRVGHNETPGRIA